MRDGVIWESGRPPIANAIYYDAPPTATAVPRGEALVRRDDSRMPPWFYQAITVALLILVAILVLRTFEMKSDFKDQLSDLNYRLQVQETYMKNSREHLIAHGWDVSDDGKISKRKEETK